MNANSCLPCTVTKLRGGASAPPYYEANPRYHDSPTLGGFVISTDFPDGVEGKLNTIEGKPGNKIFFQQSAFKAGKEYGISLEVSMHGQPIQLEDFGISQNMLKLPKIYNVGDFFNENESLPRNFEKASFLDGVKSYLKKGGKVNKITIDASTSKMPAGHMDNDHTKPKWKELNEDDIKELFPEAFVSDCDFSRKLILVDIKRISDMLKEKNK